MPSNRPLNGALPPDSADLARPAAEPPSSTGPVTTGSGPTPPGGPFAGDADLIAGGHGRDPHRHVAHPPIRVPTAGPALAGNQSLPRWFDYCKLLLVVLLIKVIVLGWGVVQATPENFSFDDYHNNFHHHRIIGRYKEPPQFDFFELWGSSDAQWYYTIAESGYPPRDQFDQSEDAWLPKLIAEDDTQNIYAFFPLWPLVIRLVAACGLELYAAALVGANLVSLLLVLVMFAWLSHRAGKRTAFWTAVLMMASPFAIFFHVPFTEGLFTLLAILVFVFSERRWWPAAGLCIGLAIVTRPTGIALILVPLTRHLVDAIRNRRWSWPRTARLAWLLIAFLPFGMMLWHHHRKTGDAFYFLEATHWWGYDQSTMWQNFWRNTYETLRAFPELPWHGFHSSQIDFIVLALSGVVLLIGLRTVPLHYCVYVGAVLVIPLLTKDLMSFSRYAIVAWPLWYIPVVVVRDENRRWVFGVLAVLMIPLQMLAIDEFVNWHWVA